MTGAALPLFAVVIRQAVPLFWRNGIAPPCPANAVNWVKGQAHAIIALRDKR